MSGDLGGTRGQPAASLMRYLESPEGFGDGMALAVEAVVDQGVPAGRINVGCLLACEVGGGEAADLRAWGGEEGDISRGALTPSAVP